MARFVFVACLIFMLSGAVFGDEIELLPGETLPELQNVNIRTNINYDSDSASYFYNYVITNPPVNSGAIRAIEIDVTMPVGGMTLSGNGLKCGQGFLESESSSIVPVGLSAPIGWITATSIRGTATWGATEEQYFIKPGSSISRLEINSRGLPGIRQVNVTPYFKQAPVEEATKEDVERVRTIRRHIAFKTKTIGPTAPPEELVPADFLQSIIGMKHEATRQGWITNPGVERSLDAKLDAAMKSIQSGNTKAASNILGAFVREIEAQGCESYDDCPKGKHLTPEAYALLKYNAQYLMDNLK
jgi:hypothetical protein